MTDADRKLGKEVWKLPLETVCVGETRPSRRAARRDSYSKGHFSGN